MKIFDNNGTRHWIHDGKHYRTDGPAVIWANGRQEWYMNGTRYRNNKSFQKAAKITDEEMVIMIIKHGNISW